MEGHVTWAWAAYRRSLMERASSRFGQCNGVVITLGSCMQSNSISLSSLLRLKPLQSLGLQPLTPVLQAAIYTIIWI